MQCSPLGESNGWNTWGLARNLQAPASFAVTCSQVCSKGIWLHVIWSLSRGQRLQAPFPSCWVDWGSLGNYALRMADLDPWMTVEQSLFTGPELVHERELTFPLVETGPFGVCSCTLVPDTKIKVERETPPPPPKQSLASLSSAGGENGPSEAKTTDACCYYWQCDHLAQATCRTSIHSSCLQTRLSGLKFLTGRCLFLCPSNPCLVPSEPFSPSAYWSANHQIPCLRNWWMQSQSTAKWKELTLCACHLLSVAAASWSTDRDHL